MQYIQVAIVYGVTISTYSYYCIVKKHNKKTLKIVSEE